MILDIHTHRLPASPSASILSCDLYTPIPHEAVWISAGIHPWYLSADNLPRQKEWLDQKLSDPRLIALGEAGLDKCRATPFPLQEEAFRYVCSLSESHHLPLIIHNVKSTAELIALRKELRPTSPWLIHGFRGKKELALSLLKQGFYLSFGERYNPESIQAIPSDRILLETDESVLPIEELYLQTAQLRNVSADTLHRQVQDTINFLFFNR